MNRHSDFVNFIKNDIPFSFSKYGDGEYKCITFDHINKYNCDFDNYTNKLSEDLKKSFIYMVNEAPNAYIGWWDFNTKMMKMYENLVYDPNIIKKTDYETFIFVHLFSIKNNFNENERKIELYKAIKNSKRKKIIICNELLIKSKLLLNIDDNIIIPFNNWYDTQFNDVLKKIKDIINDNYKNYMILTCCGMSAKVLIYELTKLSTKGIYIDLGSSIDFICTKKDSRGWNYDYNYIYSLFEEIIDDKEEWNDKKYDYIYEKAQNTIGIHGYTMLSII